MRFCNIKAAPNGKIFPFYDPADRSFNFRFEEAWHDDAQTASAEDSFVNILRGGRNMQDLW